MNSTIVHPDVWMYDLQNRGYTIEETPRDSLTLIVVKLSGVEKGRIEVSGREGIFILRERIVGNEFILPLLSEVERDLITFKKGSQIVNTNTGAEETKINGSWA